jgi:hypothetical protein
MKIAILIPIILIGEFGATFLFRFIHKKLGPGEADQKPSLITVLKGVIERSVITVFLVFNYPHILIAFAALKLGTRFQDEDTKISNDYFLIGNLISLGISVLYVWLYHHTINLLIG